MHYIQTHISILYFLHTLKFKYIVFKSPMIKCQLNLADKSKKIKISWYAVFVCRNIITQILFLLSLQQKKKIFFIPILKNHFFQI